MEADYTENLGDERWSFNDKVDQLKGIINLHEQSLKWMKTKEKLIQRSQKKEIKLLELNTNQTREALKNFKDRDVQGIQRILHEDPHIERICLQHPPQEIEEYIRQWVFSKRKELDRVKCEVAKKEDELYNKRLQIKLLQQPVEGKNVKSQVVLKCQEVAAEIQRVVLQQEAARILQSSYDKMKRILQKDARKFDPILAGLKEDVTIQCECVLKALELGQIATEDEGRLKKECYEKLKKIKEVASKNSRQIKDLRRKIERIKETQLLLTDVNLHNKFQLNQTSEIEARFMKVKEENVDLINIISALKEKFEARTPEELFTRVEYVTKTKYRLLNQKSIAECWRKDSLMRSQHMNTKLESLRHILLHTVPVYLLEKARLEGSLKELEGTKAEAKKEMDHLSHYMIGIRYLLLHLSRTLRPISLENPISYLELQAEEMEDGPRQSISQSLQGSTTRKILKPMQQDSSLNEPCCEEMDLDENHLFDVISLKSMFMVKQLEPYDFLEEKEEQVRDFFVLNASRNFEEIDDDELPEKSKDSVTGIEDVTFARCGMQTRQEMKEETRTICEKNEVKPTMPTQKFCIVKHECY